MNKTATIIIVTFLCLIFQASFSIRASDISPRQVEELLRTLDSEIDRFDTYKEMRIKRIDSLKVARNMLRRYSRKWLEGTMHIAHAYSAFNNDSAIYYYSEGVEAASEAGLDSLATEFQLRHATYMSISGYMQEALDEIARIDTTGMNPGVIISYYACTRQMYSYIAFYYDRNTSHFDKWQKKAVEAQRRLLPLLKPGSDAYLMNLGEYLCSNQEYARSDRILKELIRHLDPSETSYPIACHILSTAAAARGKQTDRLYYLALSAISDLRNATLEVTSIQELGGLLFELGDVERAHRYLNVAIDNVVQSRASVRMGQTTELLNVVASHHNRQVARWRRLVYVIILILVISLIALVVAIWYLRRQLRKVALMKQSLQTASLAKDVYISQFLNLCAIFMDKLKEICKLANRKISAGQTEELYRITKSGKFIEEQSKEFYRVFDDSFLNLYPDFVERVNSLLRPEERIELAEGEGMNSDLRILAFMRLGIDDTNRIAHTLNYSVNTIYAYRNKLRNKAINRETFEADIMAIGSGI